MSKVHIVPHNENWAVKVEENPNPLSVHQTQEEAINAGKPVAESRNSELVIHRPHGAFREDWSYGNDPYPPRDIVKHFKIVIEKHPDGYIAYPIGIVGAVVGQGETYEEALSDVKSALACYMEIFGQEILEDIPPIEIFIAEAGVTV